jgi:two-component system response regulator HydG
MTRILLVEDDEEIGRLLERVLISAGYEVDRSYAVAGACSHLDRRSYELVLADARLPDGTGMDVADRAIEKGVNTLIIAGCALLYPELRRYEFLPNPVRPDKILSGIKRLLASTPDCWAPGWRDRAQTRNPLNGSLSNDWI